MVNQWFYNRYKQFWDDFKASFPYIKDIEVGKRLSLNDGTFRAMTTTHYRAARSLKDVLMAASSQRRGHILAPGPPAADPYHVPPDKLPKQPPPMLMQGDHNLSYNWASDASFRKQMGPVLVSQKPKKEIRRMSA